MNEQELQILKNKIESIGRLLWEKDLATGLNGNISQRVDQEKILLTGHGTCLGLLQSTDTLLMDLNGKVLESGSVSTENLLHREIYKNFPNINAVIHTHTTFTNGYFIEQESLTPRIYESKFYLGEVKSVPQHTPSVTDSVPVIEALRSNNIIVLRNHGVVAMGQGLFDCFLLIQALEDAVKMEAVSRLFKSEKVEAKNEKHSVVEKNNKRYKLFSQEQIDEIVKVVNADPQLKELGHKTDMTMDLAVQLNETGTTYSFEFRKGKIERVGNDDNVEFLITAPEKVWRAVFNREIDPFVATTQKKMQLRGDFARISKWYAPCSRVFELWQRVPVE